MAGVRCTVCNHPSINQINKLLVEDKFSLQDVAGRFGLKKNAVHRHKQNHLPKQLQRAVERRVRKAEDEVLDVAIATRQKRLEAQQERWDALHSRALVLIRQDDLDANETGVKIAKEARETERLVSQELSQFGETGPGKGSGPVVVIVQPYIEHSSDVEIPKIAVLGQRDEPIAVLPEPDEAIEAEFEDVPDLESAPGAKNVPESAPESAPGAKTQEPEPPDGDYF